MPHYMNRDLDRLVELVNVEGLGCKEQSILNLIDDLREARKTIQDLPSNEMYTEALSQRDAISHALKQCQANLERVEGKLEGEKSRHGDTKATLAARDAELMAARDKVEQLTQALAETTRERDEASARSNAWAAEHDKVIRQRYELDSKFRGAAEARDVYAVQLKAKQERLDKLTKELEEARLHTPNGYVHKQIYKQVCEDRDEYREGMLDAQTKLLTCDAEIKKLRVELEEAKTQNWRKDYDHAAATVAQMHEAAMGTKCGPVNGVVEDVAELRKSFLNAVSDRNKADKRAIEMEQKAAEHARRVCQTSAELNAERKAHDNTKGELAYSRRDHEETKALLTTTEEKLNAAAGRINGLELNLNARTHDLNRASATLRDAARAAGTNQDCLPEWCNTAKLTMARDAKKIFELNVLLEQQNGKVAVLQKKLDEEDIALLERAADAAGCHPSRLPDWIGEAQRKIANADLKDKLGVVDVSKDAEIGRLRQLVNDRELLRIKQQMWAKMTAETKEHTHDSTQS